MSLSIFDNDDTLGASSRIVTFRGTGTSFPTAFSGDGWLRDAIRNKLNSRIGTVESVTVETFFAGLNRIANFTVRMHVMCSTDATVIARMIRDVLAERDATYNVPLVERAQINVVGLSSCGNTSGPDLVAGGSVFNPTVLPTYQGGDLATVNIPIPPDDTTVSTGGGIVDSITSAVKGIDTTLLIVLGLAAFLVARKI